MLERARLLAERRRGYRKLHAEVTRQHRELAAELARQHRPQSAQSAARDARTESARRVQGPTT